jgi:hypothetical protein
MEQFNRSEIWSDFAEQHLAKDLLIKELEVQQND